MAPEVAALCTTCVAIVGGGRYRLGITGVVGPIMGMGTVGAAVDGLARELGCPLPEIGMIGPEVLLPSVGDGGGAPRVVGGAVLGRCGVSGPIGGGISGVNGHPGMFGIDVCWAIPPINWVNIVVRWSNRVLMLCC